MPLHVEGVSFFGSVPAALSHCRLWDEFISRLFEGTILNAFAFWICAFIAVKAWLRIVSEQLFLNHLSGGPRRCSGTLPA